ncbi:hypothetical protein LUW74_25120 [Actinomadura madurae]|uniref:hypothetical protein n=1 Tax=Actinomadura madurae TaxID=1993 RepID=UPI002026DAE4|nr:hypothetical protein [Actinomadura madurae]MCP9966772.1 hypothetical protein [Actinomadura madurae]URN06277.1 hypothetical protein LUW74_25120 [Actinomadura madurae]
MNRAADDRPMAVLGIGRTVQAVGVGEHGRRTPVRDVLRDRARQDDERRVRQARRHPGSGDDQVGVTVL